MGSRYSSTPNETFAEYATRRLDGMQGHWTLEEVEEALAGKGRRAHLIAKDTPTRRGLEKGYERYREKVAVSTPETIRAWGQKVGEIWYVVTVTINDKLDAHVMLPTPAKAHTEAKDRLKGKTPGSTATLSKGGDIKKIYRVNPKGEVEGPLDPLTSTSTTPKRKAS